MGDKEEVKLYRTWSSPFPLRVIWALDLKGIQYKCIFEDLSNKSPDLLRYNPVYGKVPVLVHNGKPVSESLVIVEYIEETWPTKHPLLPQDPLGRATARFWVRFADDKVLPSVWTVYKSFGEEQRAAMVHALDNLKLVEEQIKGKRFFGGDDIGLVDIALGWMVMIVPAFDEITGLTLIDSEKFPSLAAWMKEFHEYPSIKETWPPRDRLLIKYQLLIDGFRKEIV